MATSSMAPSIDDVIDAVATVERRNVLVPLLNRQQLEEVPTTAGDADDVADCTARHIAMVHSHLPKLDDYGFVDWDRATDEVRRGPNFDEIRPLVELLDEHEDELPSGWR